jgi:1-aminocyclopropane-1-carboxylate deaminase/D-cysteine desulfhydrase-like pyridoxal-dependent ACC family enzyme
LNKNPSPIEAFHATPRMPLVNLGTPVQRCIRLEKEIPHSPNIFIKRDDFLGHLIGGNKVRKLEYVMADVRAKGATAVVTIGSIQSNHARITALVARSCGLGCALVLNGVPPEPPTANYRIENLLGVEIHHVDTREDRAGRMAEVAASLRARGEIVYMIPLGASDAIGSFGFVNAFDELVRQEAEMGITFDAIVIGSSSGGTQAGLEVGKRLFGRSGLQIVGISPDDPPATIRETIAGIMEPMLKRLGLHGENTASEIVVDDRYIGDGYGIASEASREAADLFARTEGVLLDPVYTSKSAAGILEYCRSGRFAAGQNVLFWHTGGLVTLFE